MTPEEMKVRQMIMDALVKVPALESIHIPQDLFKKCVAAALERIPEDYPLQSSIIPTLEMYFPQVGYVVIKPQMSYSTI